MYVWQGGGGGGDASLHTARFYEIYNQPPEVDLSFKLWLSKWQHRVAAG